MTNRRKAGYWLFSILVVLTLVGFWYFRRTGTARGPFLIGFADNRPYHYRNLDGSPAGMCFDVLSEAAKRAGIDLKWVYRPENSEIALRSGAVELWPLIADFPDRRKYFYISGPWLGTDYFVVARKDAAQLSGDFSGSIGHDPGAVKARLIKTVFPMATAVQLSTIQDVVEAVCGGRVAAGVFEAGAASVALETKSPQCSGVGIRAYPMPGLRVNFGIGANYGNSKTADRLLDEIHVLAREGFLITSFAKYSIYGLGEITATHGLIQLEERQRWLYWGIGGLSLVLLMTLLLCWSLYRAKTDLAKADAAKAESMARYAMVSRASNDVIWEWNPATGQMGWSESMQTLFGYSSEETGQTMSWHEELIHPDERKGVVEGIDRALKEGRSTWSAEYRFRRLNGQYAFVADRGCIVYDDDGKPLQMVGAMSDITPRRHLEEQLRQSQKMEAVGRLAGGVAHDFNNLLTIINGYCEFLLENVQGDATVREYLREIEKAGQNAAVLTRQLLAFSRRQVIEPVVVDLNSVLSESEKMIRRLLGEDVELVIHLNPGIGKVFADVGQLQQVVVNLVANARDAMPSGGRLLLEISNVDLGPEYFERRPEVYPGSYVLLSVSDTGSGMDEETQAHIFEPFYTTKGKGVGTGLGLSTVYGIVKQIGGWIWVYSEPGSGTTFKVYLPRSDASVTAGALPRMKDAQLRGTETILIVEDQEDVRKLAIQILTRNGYAVTGAANAEEALSIVAKQPGVADLLLTDVILPGMSGRELAERIAKLQPNLRTLYVSGYPEKVIAHRGILLPGITFLPKPFSQEALLRKVREVLEQKIPD